MYNGFKNCDDNDIIMISDVDEIPFKKTIYEAFFKLNNKDTFLIGVNQKLFYYYVNLQKSQLWQGTIITKKKYLGNNEEEIKENIQILRNERTYINNVFSASKSFNKLFKQKIVHVNILELKK